MGWTVKYVLVHKTRRNGKGRSVCSGTSICFVLRMLLNCPNNGKGGERERERKGGATAATKDAAVCPTTLPQMRDTKTTQRKGV